jgi:hypothetical protein
MASSDKVMFAIKRVAKLALEITGELPEARIHIEVPVP